MENNREEQAREGQLRKVNVLDYVMVLAKYKRMFVRVVMAVFVLTVVLFWLILSRWYKSTAVVMPPKQSNALGLMSALNKATSSLKSLGLGGSSDQLAEFQTILASRRVLEAVIVQFDLQNVYDLDTMEKTVKELQSNVMVSTGKEDVSLEIVVYDTEPNRAAEMANSFVKELNKVYLEMSVAEAKGNREFLERRYLENLRDLKKAEEDFKSFQEKYSVYSVPEQLKAAVGAAAMLQSQIAVKEVQLGLLSSSTSIDNPSRQNVELELRELKKQLNAMRTGPASKGSQFQIFAPFDKAPEIGMEYFRRYRELEIQGKILELLMPLYEQSKIEEQRDTPSVIVLDNAVPAIKAAKPKRALLTILITFASFVFVFVVALFLERLEFARQQRSGKDQERFAIIKRELHWKNLLK